MEVYKTIKRSFSASSSSRQSTSTSAGSAGWIHPPSSLTNGRIEYAVKLLGQIEVQEPKGTHIVRDAIHAIRFHLQLKRGETGHSGAKLRKVVLQVSIYGVNVVDAKTRGILFKHQLHKISFCADDKQDKRIFSYIAKNDSGKHQCFVFLSDKMAENITLTIGEAFDLAYENFIKKRGRVLENQKQQLLMRKRIAELEEENAKLRSTLASCTCQGRTLLPMTPVPPSPPTAIIRNLAAFDHANSTPPPLPFALPPRRTNGQQSSSDLLAEIFEQERTIPPLNMSDLFDDEFDPRSEEQSGQRNTVEQFEALLRRVDKQLADVNNDVNEWNMERGDTGDSGGDWNLVEEGEDRQRNKVENQQQNKNQ